MAKKNPIPKNPDQPGARRAEDDEALELPTLLWALGILAVLVIVQRLIWGE